MRNYKLDSCRRFLLAFTGNIVQGRSHMLSAWTWETLRAFSPLIVAMYAPTNQSKTRFLDSAGIVTKSCVHLFRWDQVLNTITMMYNKVRAEGKDWTNNFTWKPHLSREYNNNMSQQDFSNCVSLIFSKEKVKSVLHQDNILLISMLSNISYHLAEPE